MEATIVRNPSPLPQTLPKDTDTTRINTPDLIEPWLHETRKGFMAIGFRSFWLGSFPPTSGSAADKYLGLRV